MERHKRQLETYTRNHECERYNEQRIGLGAELQGDIVEIKRTCQTIDKRETHHKHCRREHSCKHVLDGSLMAFITVLIHSHHSSQRKRGAFKADDKQQEVTRRNHEIHTEQRYKQQFVELAAAHNHQLAVCPAARLDEHDQHAHIQYVLNHRAYRRCVIHPRKGVYFAAVAPDEACHCKQQEQHRGEPGCGVKSLFRHERVIKKHQQENNQQADLLSHCKKL